MQLEIVCTLLGRYHHGSNAIVTKYTETEYLAGIHIAQSVQKYKMASLSAVSATNVPVPSLTCLFQSAGTGKITDV